MFTLENSIQILLRIGLKSPYRNCVVLVSLERVNQFQQTEASSVQKATLSLVTNTKLVQAKSPNTNSQNPAYIINLILSKYLLWLCIFFDLF